MPANKSMKQQGTNSVEGVLRRSTPKAAGTRAGTLLDWRGDSVKSEKAPRERFGAVRDGR